MPRQKLNLEQIKDHWKNCAKTFGTDLRATTKAGTAKQIEIYALIKNINSIKSTLPIGSKILEVGCGNGHNLLSLYESYPEYKYEGIDFIQEMIDSAEQNKRDYGVPDESMRFKVGNVLDLKYKSNSFDLIFTVRCLINLNSDQLQLAAIRNISSKIKQGGHLLMLENSQNSYDKQNKLRHLVGLEKRIPAEFNHFFNEDRMNRELSKLGLKETRNENLTHLHDLVLYILVPMINGGNIDYKHPIVEAATRLSIAISESDNDPLGEYGQNRLYLFQKI